jgi:hypothetical protein
VSGRIELNRRQKKMVFSENFVDRRGAKEINDKYKGLRFNSMRVFETFQFTEGGEIS